MDMEIGILEICELNLGIGILFLKKSLEMEF